MKRKPAKKRKPWCNLIYVCPHCMAATVLEQPIPAIQYGMSRLPKARRK